MTALSDHIRVSHDSLGDRAVVLILNALNLRLLVRRLGLLTVRKAGFDPSLLLLCRVLSLRLSYRLGSLTNVGEYFISDFVDRVGHNSSFGQAHDVAQEIRVPSSFH